MKAKSFKSFLKEDFEPYKLVILTHSAAGVRDTKSEPAESGTELLKKVGKLASLYWALRISAWSQCERLKPFSLKCEIKESPSSSNFPCN